jgi:hypothetical protein
MPSTDYPGQGFNAITVENDLDDSESGNAVFGIINFESDLDDSEAGSAKDQIQRESDDPGGGGGGGGITTYYAMRAIDPDCPTLTYVTWVVTGSPDATGAQYAGSRCGASPLTDITITAKWQI